MKCQFSISHYEDCIDKALELGYKIGPVCDWTILNESTKFILLRHDVDFSLQCAFQLALVESRLKVRSTYYVMLQSDYYNALSSVNVKIIKAISDLGHEIGYHPNSLIMLEDEELLLEKIIKKPVRSYAHHFPLVSPQPKFQRHYLDARSKNIEIDKYISDSCRNWREGCMCKNFKYNKIQILTHPEWWTVGGYSRDEAIFNIQNILLRDVEENMAKFTIQIKPYLENL